MTRISLLAALSLLTVACNDGPKYAGLEFEIESPVPVPVSFESDRIEIPAGVAVQVAVDPLSDGDDYASDDAITLRPADDDLLGVYSGTRAREFVLVGLREGDTCLEVRINRHEKECIDVHVLPVE